MSYHQVVSQHIDHTNKYHDYLIISTANLNDEPQSGVHDHELLLQSIGIFIAVGGCTCAFVIFVAVLLGN